MKFFMHSKCGEGAGLLYRIQQEGNDCSIFIKEKDYSSVYDGMLEKSDGLAVDVDTIVIFDSSGHGKLADKFRNSGYKVFGASEFHDQLENDRQFGLEFMSNNGINVPVTNYFSDFKEGIKFVKDNKKTRFVFKPSGDLPSKLTYSSSDAEDLINYMCFVEKFYGSKIKDFVLQEFIEGPIISSEYWVGKHGFIEPINHTIEVKKLMNDNLGPSTGCSGNIVWLGNEGSNLCKEMRRVEEELIKNNYLGPIDLNAIVNKGEIFGLEWTPRFGLDALPTFLQLYHGEVSKLISDIVCGNATKLEVISGCVAGGVRLSIPPYPIEPKSAREVQRVSPNKGIPIRGFENDIENLYYYEVMIDDNDEMVHSDGTGVIAVVSDIGNTPVESLEFPYDLLEECKVPDKQYRTDLKTVLPEMYEDVQNSLGAF